MTETNPRISQELLADQRSTIYESLTNRFSITLTYPIYVTVVVSHRHYYVVGSKILYIKMDLGSPSRCKLDIRSSRMLRRQISSYFSTFRNNISDASSRILHSKTNLLSISLRSVCSAQLRLLVHCKYLTPKRNYLKTQFVPRSKHFSSQL